jgi:hypothetical protein
LLDESAPVPTRWCVLAPPNWVILGPEPGAGSPLAWGWRGLLWAPRPQASEADLEAWFAGTDSAPDAAPVAPALVAWRDADEPLQLTHVPRQFWLVGCSLLTAVLGLALTRLALSPRRGRSAWAWVLGGLLLTIVLALAAFAPALASQLAYGAQPGLLVVLLLAVAQWLLHERHRRRVIFLPSFSRPRTGSSVARSESRPPGEPSTVDAPRATSSSLERGS